MIENNEQFNQAEDVIAMFLQQQQNQIKSVQLY